VHDILRGAEVVTEFESAVNDRMDGIEANQNNLSDRITNLNSEVTGY
jgi:hypothetical protein